MKILLTIALISVLFVEVAQKATFEVSSVRINTTGRAASDPPVTAVGDRFMTVGAGLISILQFAYRHNDGRSLRSSDVIGLPAWAQTRTFDIQAKAQDGRPEPAQLRLLVQSLLEDRFRLKAHWEERTVDVYNLVTAKDGPKVKRSSDQSANMPSEASRLMGKSTPSGMNLTMTATNMPMNTFINIVQQYTGRPVLDQTGLAGNFDFRLEFFIESTNGPAPPGALPPEPGGPEIFTAVREQLGLRFESAKGLVQVLVIDSVQLPTDN